MLPYPANRILDEVFFAFGRSIIKIVTLGYCFPNPQRPALRVLITFVGFVVAFAAILCVLVSINN
jgi:hypothetical protein